MYSFPDFEPVSCSIVASFPAFKFLRRQGRWSVITIFLRIYFTVIHTIKGFSNIVNKAEVDVFLEFPWFLYDPANVSNLISVSSAFSKTSLNNRKFTVHILLKPGLENFEHYFTSVWDELDATKAVTELNFIVLLLLSCFSHVRLCVTPETAAH